MKSIGSALFLLFFAFYSIGQNLQKPVVNLKSPEIAELARYTEQPVDISTGIPDINIPWYTINTGKLTLPISLSYHAGGIKVDQQSTIVGLGWSLNAGGFVNQVVRDLSDGQWGDVNFKGLPLLDPTDPNYEINMPLGAFYSYPYKQDGTVDAKSMVVHNYRSSNYKDKEPDLYTIAAPDLNGIISLNNVNKFTHYDLDTFQIVKGIDNPKSTNQLIFRNKNGITYVFGQNLLGKIYKDTTCTATGDFSLKETSNSYTWYLNSIISADLSDTINIDYIKRDFSDTFVASVTYSEQSNVLYGNSVAHTSSCKSLGVDKKIYGQCFIDRITFKGGFIKFEYAADRLDIAYFGRSDNRIRLSKIEVYNTSNNKIKEIELNNNSYFERIGEQLWSTASSPDTKKAMKLDGVVFDSFTGIPNKWEFSYDQSKSLPVLHSYKQDLWGYYNGKGGNYTDFIPKTYKTDDKGVVTIVGGCRDADFEYMKTGILTRIKYPTGGYTDYEYEANQYADKATTENKVVDNKNLKYQAMNVPSDCDFFGSKPNQILNQLYTINEELTSERTAQVYINFSGYEGYGAGPMQGAIYRNGNCILSGTYYPNSSNKVLSQIVEILKGDTFRFELNANGATQGKTGSPAQFCNAPLVEAGLSYKYYRISTYPVTITKQAGGLRIKSIKTYREQGKLALEKRYKYGTEEKGFGELLTDPYRKNISYHDYLEQDASGNGKSITSTLDISSSSAIELGLSNGIPVFYPTVTEYSFDFNNSTSNAIQYNFRRPLGYREHKPGLYYPYDQVYYPFWANNKPLNTNLVHLKSEGGKYIPVKTVLNNYTLIEKLDTYVLKIQEIGPDYTRQEYSTSLGCYYVGPNPRKYWAYSLPQPRVRYQLNGTKIIMHTAIGNIQEESNYAYNDFNDIKRQVIKSSGGQDVVINYNYTGEMGLTSISEKGVYSLPVLTEKIKVGKLVEGNFYKYNDDLNIVEYYTYVSNSNKPATTSITYNTPPTDYRLERNYKYSETNNIREVKEKNVVTTYLWSYSNKYPIAEIVNIPYSEVEKLMSLDNIRIFASRISPTKSEIEAFLLPILKVVQQKNATITYYTYDVLVGMTSKTNSQGVTTYYEYDKSGRLLMVKDNNGNVINRYEYHYKE